MKEAARNLSLALMLLGLSVGVHGQGAFITPKKYDFKQSQVIFAVDSTLLENTFSLPQVYSYEKLALFCRLEEKVAQKSNVNMRFRLGSLDYVNYLEQKPNWRMPKK